MIEVIFGDKDRFAIEIKQKDFKNYFIRFWFSNEKIGKFNKAGSLKSLTNNYETLKEEYIYLWEEKFDIITDMEIFEDIHDIDFDASEEIQTHMMKRMDRYCFLTFDYQFNSFDICTFFNKNENMFKFLIYEMDGVKEPKLHSYKVEKDYFFTVYIEFMEFALANNIN
jgi:hypothetical protein